MNSKEGLIAISKTSSKGTSLRISLLKAVAEKMKVKENQFIGFYLEGEKVVVRKITG